MLDPADRIQGKQPPAAIPWDALAESWSISSATETFLTSRLPPAHGLARSSYIRMLLVGLLLQFVLQKFRSGLMPEKSPKIRSD